MMPKKKKAFASSSDHQLRQLQRALVAAEAKNRRLQDRLSVYVEQAAVLFDAKRDPEKIEPLPLADIVLKFRDGRAFQFAAYISPSAAVLEERAAIDSEIVVARISFGTEGF